MFVRHWFRFRLRSDPHVNKFLPCQLSSEWANNSCLTTFMTTTRTLHFRTSFLARFGCLRTCFISPIVYQSPHTIRVLPAWQIEASMTMIKKEKRRSNHRQINSVCQPFPVKTRILASLVEPLNSHPSHHLHIVTERKLLKVRLCLILRSRDSSSSNSRGKSRTSKETWRKISHLFLKHRKVRVM